MSEPARRGPEKKTWGIALRVATTLAIAALVILAVRTLDMAALKRSLLSASPAPLVLAAALSFGMQVAKSAYWRTILAPMKVVPLRTMLWYTVAANGTSLVLPMRGGEALRVWWLKRAHGIPLTALGAAVAFEKVFDLTALVLVVSPLPWLLPDQPWLGRLRWALPVVLLVVVALVLLARRGRATVKWLADLKLFDDAGPVVRAFGFVMVSWAADVTMILLVLHSVGIPAHLEAALFVLLSVNLAIAIPAAPGNLGSHELGAGLALTTLHVAEAPAAAFAILYHGVQIAMLLVAWSAGTVVTSLVARRA
ncbi:MAG TPA: lysylphosphatidylglycerol synthase transmembrane domain-containing protein [Polyangiaceae bacterium]